MTYTHPAALIRAHTSGVLRARAAYAAENHCMTCNAPIPKYAHRRPVRCADCREETQ